ncbi:MAG: hypothetical protein KDI12_00975, partial [Anaerolineae bacterium]|nr:hypothetical protein [Anaerolineae bacterium]
MIVMGSIRTDSLRRLRAARCLEKIVTQAARGVKTSGIRFTAIYPTISTRFDNRGDSHIERWPHGRRRLLKLTVTWSQMTANKCLVLDEIAARFLADIGLAWYNIASREDWIACGRYLRF